MCPMELAHLAEGYPHPQKLGVEVWSVSMDTAYTHLARQQRKKLLPNVRYPMAPDLTPSLSRLLRVYDPEIGLTPRGTFCLPSHRSPSRLRNQLLVCKPIRQIPLTRPRPLQQPGKATPLPIQKAARSSPLPPQKERAHTPPLSSALHTALIYIYIAQPKNPSAHQRPKKNLPLDKALFFLPLPR
jgi:hypothetical protein